MDEGELQNTINWLLQKGRLITKPTEFIQALGTQLIKDGTPVWRLRFNCLTIHPQMAGWSVIWSTDMSSAEEVRASHEYRTTEAYLGSPLAAVVENNVPYRRKLKDLDRKTDHQVLFGLRDEGATDYLALPIVLSDGNISSLVLATKTGNGFTDYHISVLIHFSAHLAPVLEVMVARDIARAVLDTYVGPRTSERVLAGQIRRGDGETIDAAVWFCDLRDFTPLTETLPPQSLLALLNRYFEIIAAAVAERGGEVLRFIGDAMLIVFPVAEYMSANDACMQAVKAATVAFAEIEAFNKTERWSDQAQTELPTIRFGVGLHIGEVIYGNVGAPGRLDFTVMGPAVNLTARLENLTKALGKPLLMSSAFAALIETECESMGYHEMKGVSDKHEIFSLASLHH